MKNLLIVGGATRNVGKTTFIENLLKKFGDEHKIISLKIKAIYPNDTFFHGNDEHPLKKNEPYRIKEMHLNDRKSDSSRMLSAGAYKVIYIKSKIEFLKEAFSDFLNQIEKDVLIICESNSLRDLIKPAAYLFIRRTDSEEMKPSAKRLFALADKVIFSNGKSFDFKPDLLKIKNFSWQISDD